MHVPTAGGGFHVKAGRLPIGPGYAAFKVNGNLPDNRAKHGRRRSRARSCCSTPRPARRSRIDSIEITLQRTGAATAVAARHLARPDCRLPPSTAAAPRAASSSRRCATCSTSAGSSDDRDAAAERFAGEIAGLDVDVPAVPREVARASDVIVTCTSSNEPFLGPDDVRPGTFVAAIGADNPDKSEIDPALMARARVVTDLTERRHMGDLHHSLAAGTMRVADVHAELGELVAGRKGGRTQARDHAVRRHRRRHPGRRRLGACQLARDRNAGRRISLG